MARKTSSRMDMRRMAEAAESRGANGDDAPAKPKRARAKAKKKTTKRAKDKVAPRRILMWGIYNGNMKEEARFSYVEREAAEKKLGQLRDKSTKKLYFIQPIKVPVGDAAAGLAHGELDPGDEPVVKKTARRRDEEE